MTTYHFPLRTSPVLISALLSILGVAIALGIIEMTYRSMESPHLEPHFARPHFYYIPPGAHNFRDQSYSFTKPENTFRTVVIGDSFTFGPSMQFDDAFPKRLERILNYSPGALRSEVINFGESGFATVHEVNVVKTALEFSPDLVIHEITLNDAQIERYNPNRDLAAHRFGELTLSYPLSAWHSLKWVLQRMKNHRSIQAYIDYHLDSFQAGRYWDIFLSETEHMHRLAESKNAKFVSVIFPLFDFDLNESYPFLEIHKKIKTSLSEKNIPTLDLFNVFRDIPKEELQLKPGKDSHPNELAHRLAAERIYHFLLKRGFLPENFVPVIEQKQRNFRELEPGKIKKMTAALKVREVNSKRSSPVRSS